MNAPSSYCFFVTFIGYSGSVIRTSARVFLPTSNWGERRLRDFKKAWGDEGIDWIRGTHAYDSPEVLAMRTARALVGRRCP